MNEAVGFTLTAGHLYRLRSRNLPYGVYNGRHSFIGIREKFGELYLSTEYAGATAVALEDLGPLPDGYELRERLGDDPRNTQPNTALYEYLAASEKIYGRGVGYGGRPGDPEVPSEGVVK